MKIKNDFNYKKIIPEITDEIFSTLSLGHTENVYRTAFEVELSLRNIFYQSLPVIPIKYKDFIVGYVEADLIINNEVLVELKIDKKIYNRAIIQLEKYMRHSKLKVGIVINFGSEQKRPELKFIENKTVIYDGEEDK